MIIDVKFELVIRTFATSWDVVTGTPQGASRHVSTMESFPVTSWVITGANRLDSIVYLKEERILRIKTTTSTNEAREKAKKGNISHKIACLTRDSEQPKAI